MNWHFNRPLMTPGARNRKWKSMKIADNFHFRESRAIPYSLWKATRVLSHLCKQRHLHTWPAFDIPVGIHWPPHLSSWMTCRDTLCSASTDLSLKISQMRLNLSGIAPPPPSPRLQRYRDSLVACIKACMARSSLVVELSNKVCTCCSSGWTRPWTFQHIICQHCIG